MSRNRFRKSNVNKHMSDFELGLSDFNPSTFDPFTEWNGDEEVPFVDLPIRIHPGQF